MGGNCGWGVLGGWGLGSEREKGGGRGVTNVNIPLNELEIIGLGDDLAVEGGRCAGHDSAGLGDRVEVGEERFGGLHEEKKKGGWELLGSKEREELCFICKVHNVDKTFASMRNLMRAVPWICQSGDPVTI